MATAAQRLEEIRSTLPAGVDIVAVSKFQTLDAILDAYRGGQRKFGESRVGELLEKEEILPKDIEWHFIGHVQTNKLRRLIGHASIIESVDSERLLELIDRESLRAGVTTRVLLQVHVAREETKFGFSPEELREYFQGRRFEHLKATHICGLMAMATNTDDTEEIEREFKEVASLRDEILEMCPDLRGFDVLSMGMSDDYTIATSCGSNSVRIGSAIFGNRPTPSK